MSHLMTTFQQLSSVIDTLARVEDNQFQADDVHPVVRRAGDWSAEHRQLIGCIGKLASEQAKLTAQLPVREEAVKLAKRPLQSPSHKLAKLEKSLAHNLAQKDTSVSPPSPQVLEIAKALKIEPKTRTELVADLRQEIAAVQAEIDAATVPVKKAEASLKGVRTKLANVGAKIAEAEQALAAHVGKLEQLVVDLQSVVEKVTKRRKSAKRIAACKARKAARRAARQATIASVPTALSDEDVRTLAAQQGMNLRDDELDAARELFTN